MNTVLKVGAAGAIALAGVAAHASIASPSGSSSDAVLFAEVLNSAGTAAVASYAGDTGVSISTLAAGGYSNTVLGTDANLAKVFAADVAADGDTLEWGVEGSQATTQFITTTFSSATNKLKTISNSTLSSWATGIAADISTVNSNSGGANSIEGPNPATAGVWDVTQSANTYNWYGTLDSANLALGTNETLFYVTTNGDNQAGRNINTSPELVSLTAAGLVFSPNGTTTPPPPIPLPAAVWLLGSGLLGLTGVARRKLKA